MEKRFNTVIEWKLDNNVSVLDSHLLVEMPTVTNERIKELVGKIPTGCNRITKYSQAFVLTNNVEEVKPGKSGVYSIYCCCGEWRIGGYDVNQYTELLRLTIEGE